MANNNDNIAHDGVQLSCPHFVVPGEAEMCPHCEESLCDACKTQHLQSLKASLLELSKPSLDDLSGLALQAKKAQIQCTIASRGADLTAKIAEVADSTKEKVQRWLEACKRRSINVISMKSEDAKKQIGGLFEQLCDQSEIESMKKRREALISGSNDDLNDLATFSQALAARNRMLQLVNSFDESGAISFLSGDVVVGLAEALIKFENTASEILSPVLGAGDFASTENVEEKPVPVTSSSASDVQQLPPPLLPATPLPLAASQLPVTPQHQSKRKAKKPRFSAAPETPLPPPASPTPYKAPVSQLEECPGYYGITHSTGRIIVPYGRDNCNLILVNRHTFLLIDSEGHFKREIDVEIPPYAQTIEIKDVTTDLFENVVVFTAALKRNTGRSQRAIFRMTIPPESVAGEKCSVVPSYYVASDDRSDFYGVAVTTRNRRLITACRTDLVAYEWLSMTGGDAKLNCQKPQIVHRCCIGPAPRICGVYSVDSELLYVTCSIGISNQLATVRYLNGAPPLLRNWEYVDRNGPFAYLKNVHPGKFSLAGNVAFFLIGNSIYRYEDFPADPFLRCVYTFAVPSELEGPCSAISAQRISGCRNSKEEEEEAKPSSSCYLLALLFRTGVKLFRTVGY